VSAAIKGELYQAVTLLAVVAFFELLERSRPGHRVDRRKDFSINLLAIGVVMGGGELWKAVIDQGVSALRLAGLFAASGLQALPVGVKLLMGIVFSDFCLYWVHKVMHHSAPFWKTHVFHHSIEELWWLSGSRTSLTHLFLFAVPQVMISKVLLGLTPLQAGAAFSFGVFVNVWIHTNIWVSLGPLEWLFITPNFHRVHHGARGLSRMNLGFVLTIWDRMFGTYVDPRTLDKDFRLGFVPARKGLFRMIVGY
jgi:sterol desaturase/sphingolipid hydroxylase (fatty acid hydroxylase superfamily)